MNTAQIIADLSNERDTLRARLDAVTAERDALRAANEWRDIASAPRDGTAVLGYWIRYRADGSRYEALQPFAVIYFQSERWFPLWIREDDQPTHWRPIPPPPASDGEA